MTATFAIPLFCLLSAPYTQRAQEVSLILSVDTLEGFSAACPYSCTLHTPKFFQLTETFSKSSCWAALAFMSATSALTWGRASARKVLGMLNDIRGETSACTQQKWLSHQICLPSRRSSPADAGCTCEPLIWQSMLQSSRGC